MPLVCLSNGAYLPFGIEYGACYHTYIIVASEIIQENRCFHFAAFSCCVSEKVLFF